MSMRDVADHPTELLGLLRRRGLASDPRTTWSSGTCSPCAKCSDEYDYVAKAAIDLTMYGNGRVYVNSHRQSRLTARSMALAAALLLVALGAGIGVWLGAASPDSKLSRPVLVASGIDDSTGDRRGPGADATPG